MRVLSLDGVGEWQESDLKVCPHCQEKFEDDGVSTVCPYDGALLAPLLRDEVIGSTVDGRFVITDHICYGGWADVYLSRDLITRDPVAVKVLRREYARDEQAVVRFQREIYALASLPSDSMAEIYGYGILPNGNPYLAMEYIQGTTLGELLQNGEKLTTTDAVVIGMQLCKILAIVHKAGIVHRDIKPANIMMLGGGEQPYKAKIIDFGVAHFMSGEAGITKTGELLGTERYMSPEQCRGLALDGRSDIYSLGCVLFEMLTGESPLVGSSGLDTLIAHLCTEPKNFSQTVSGKLVPAPIQSVVLKCLNKNPAMRYQSMDEVHQALDEALLSVLGVEPARTTVQKKHFFGRCWSGMRQAGMFVSELWKVLRGRS